MARRRGAYADGYSKEDVDRVLGDLGEVEETLQSEAPSRTLEEAEAELNERIAKPEPESPEAITPQPSPTRAGEQLLPGMKVGLEMPSEGIKGKASTLEGTPLGEAANPQERPTAFHFGFTPL